MSLTATIAICILDKSRATLTKEKKMKTYCQLTRELGDCTMVQGIVGVDGVNRGAMADIDLFAAFGVELPNENKDELWEVKEKRDRVVINREASPIAKGRRSVEDLKADYDAAFELMAADGVDPTEEGMDTEKYSPFFEA